MAMTNDDSAFDDSGINVADPKDRRGLKTDYISALQTHFLQTHYRGSGLALELGCGFGRLTPAIESLGYDTVALDPSLRLLKFARHRMPCAMLCAGGLPDLPFIDNAFSAVFLINVLRPLHLLGIKEVVDGIPRVLAPGGRLVLLDNLRRGDARYVEETWIRERFCGLGLELTSRRAIRSGRWPGIFAIRYGLVPKKWFQKMAAWEIARLSSCERAPWWTYHNVVFEFRKPSFTEVSCVGIHS
jgi:SAM-dependent methyltransferase